MDRNRVLTIGIIIVAVLFLFRPFGRRNEPLQRLIPDRVESEVLDELSAAMQQEGLPPAQYVAGLFQDHDIVLLGEFPKVRQHVELVSSLIPVLYEAGVTNLGFEYLLYEDQEEIDQLLSADVFDRSEAERLFFNFVVLWGYEEYMEIVEAAWRLNNGLAPGEPRFRIVGINVRRNWGYIQSREDVEDPEIIEKVLAEGVPDRFMADVILREFVDPEQKALVHLNFQNAFTRYRNKAYEENAREKGLSEVRRAGNIIYDRIGARVATVALHAPWPDSDTLSQINYPVGGVLDRVLATRPPDELAVGFDVRGTAFADIAVESDIYLTGYEQLSLGDMVDGYVMLGYLGDYQPVTPIPDFVNEANLERAVEQFPGPKDFDPRREPVPQDFSKLAAQDLESLTRVFDQFD